MGNAYAWGEPAPLKEVEFKLHIAIDFGTDGCGLAFAYKGKVTVYDKWKVRQRHRVNKTKTHILLNAQNEVACFGNNAKFMYSNLMSEKEKQSWKFFERFKMALYAHELSQSEIDANDEKKNDNKDINVNTMDKITSTNGKSMSSETVFVAAFQHLEEKAKEYLTRITKQDEVKKEEIQWLLTVPAIWSDQSKDRMKQWIIKAGLVDATIKDQCVIVYEPDCASLSIQKEYFKNNNDEEKDKFNEGDKYILVDAGGGTVDVACHEILDDGSVEEIMYPTGDKWGSCYIDDLYIILLEEIFGKQWMDELKQKAPVVYIEIVDHFQSAKATFFEDAEASIHSVQLPFEFLQFLEDRYDESGESPDNKVKEFNKSLKYYYELFGHDASEQKKDAEEVVVQLMSQNDNPQFKDGTEYIELDIRIWRALFDSKINKIITHVDKLLNLDTLKNQCNYLCLVGGFSGSLYFQSRMKQQFGVKSQYKLKMIIPKLPILSVVQGAAYFGITKHYIKARKLKQTYGISMYFTKSIAENCGISDEYIKNNESSDGKVKDCFKIIIRKNERVQEGEVKKNIAYRRGNTTLIQILCSDKTDPKVQSDGKTLATLKVPYYDVSKEIVTEFHFYGTTFRVYSYPKNNPDGKKEVDITYEK